MKIARSILICIALVLGQVGIVHAEPMQAAKVRVFIENRSDRDIQIRLEGPVSLKVNLEPGRNTVNLEPGTYTYKYNACTANTPQSGRFTVAADTLVLSTARCIGGNGPVVQSDRFFLLLTNKSNQAVSITLTGPQTQNLWLAANSSQRIEIPRGRYDYSYLSCGSTQKGKIGKPNQQHAELIIPKCKNSGTPNGNNNNVVGDNRVANLVVHNQTGSTFTLILTGPQKYTFVIPPGKTKLIPQRGRYTWVAYGYVCQNDQTDQGKINLKFDIEWTWYCGDQ